MEHEIRLIHWYDTEHRRVACGVPGLTNSTKHRRAVTCTACLTRLSETPARGNVAGIAANANWVH